MFMKLFVPVLLVVSSAVTPAFSLPFRIVVARDEKNSTVQAPVPVPLSDTATRFPDMEPLAEGNQEFRSGIEDSSNPSSLEDLATNGQSPDFLFLGCRFVISSLSDLIASIADPLHSFLVTSFSDSRVPESTIFNAQPGSIFTQRNIANQFQSVDNNAISVLSYGVQSLHVRHVIVMGHYGCGGVKAAMLPKPNTTDDFSGNSVQSWINPIRSTFANSSR